MIVAVGRGRIPFRMTFAVGRGRTPFRMIVAVGRGRISFRMTFAVGRGRTPFRMTVAVGTLKKENLEIWKFQPFQQNANISTNIEYFNDLNFSTYVHLI